MPLKTITTLLQQLSLAQIWIAFSCCLAVTIITTIVMMVQARHFYHQEGRELRRFSIMKLEWPADRFAMITLIIKIGQLPEWHRARVLKALRGQLFVDFLYMPATYGGIFLLCRASASIYYEWEDLLTGLGWLQALCWLCDIIENFYILHKIKKPVVSAEWVFMGYRLVEIIKWGVASAAVFLAVSGLLLSLIR